MLGVSGGVFRSFAKQFFRQLPWHASKLLPALCVLIALVQVNQCFGVSLSGQGSCGW
jgi:hypothetical protein